MKPEIDLGPIVATYRGRPLGCSSLFLLWLPGLLAISAPLAFGLWRGYYGYSHFGPVAATSWAWPWLLLSLLAGLIFLTLAFFRLRQSRMFFAVHKNGLRYRQGFTGTRSTLWHQFAGIATSVTQDKFTSYPLQTHLRAILYPNVGKPVHLQEKIRDLPELVTHIKASLYPRLLTNLETNLQSGQWLYFGPVSIHLKTLKAKNRTLAWEAVDYLTVEAGLLVIALKRGDILRFPVIKIPNLELLIQLIQKWINV